MRPCTVSILLVTAAAAVVAAPALRSAEPLPAPVVVELFTSQGCSSCPPADRLLARLARESSGAVMPLAFHVDYWNHGGWSDPFSSAAWTARQALYDQRLHATEYTPQAVVDGETELVGSREAELRSAIADAARRPAAKLELSLAPSGQSVVVAVGVTVPPELEGRKFDLMLAVTENGLETRVVGGENGGQTLHDDAVVRTFRRIGRIHGAQAAPRFTETVKLAPEWSRPNLSVVAFLQDRSTLEILGGAAAPLASSAAAHDGR